MILDRDNTIVEDKGHVHKVEDLKFRYGTIEGLLKLQNVLSYNFVIITNQGGIAKGLFTEDDLNLFNTAMIARLRSAGINIGVEHIFFCPHHPDVTGDCFCRKPGVDLVLLAAAKFGFDPSQAVFVGDQECDIQLGKSFGSLTFRIASGRHPPSATIADYLVANLEEVANHLEKFC